MKTTAIIICAGDATRWGNYLGVPKHLIEIEGERLLDRTVRLLRERGITDIFIVVKRPSKKYRVEGADLFDWTDDFDYPDDYENWIRRRALLHGEASIR